MTSKKLFKIVGGPSEFDLILAYLKGPTNYSGGFRAVFTIARADGQQSAGHTAFEVHGLERVRTEVDSHMIKIEASFSTSEVLPCPYCGGHDRHSEHKCRFEGFYQTRNRAGFLWLSDFELRNYFQIEPKTHRVMRLEGDEYFDAITYVA